MAQLGFSIYIVFDSNFAACLTARHEKLWARARHPYVNESKSERRRESMRYNEMGKKYRKVESESRSIVLDDVYDIDWPLSRSVPDF